MPAKKRRKLMRKGANIPFIEMIEFDNRIELIPVRPIAEMRGFLRGIDTSVERDEDRV